MGAAAVFETAAETPPTSGRRKGKISYSDFYNEIHPPQKLRYRA